MRASEALKPTLPAVFRCPDSTYDKQGDVRDEIENYPQHLVEGDKRVAHRA
jgi:hypothetical protein